MHLHNKSLSYKRAFDLYLRRGTPLPLSFKQMQPRGKYVWLTRFDDKVRKAHARQHGMIFDWQNRPLSGHPGEDYGCRCTAVPFSDKSTEVFSIELQNVFNTGRPWRTDEFVWHYFFGKGQPVTLRETGHLVNVVNAYRVEVIDDSKRLKTEIAESARKSLNLPFNSNFKNSYQMRHIVYSLGGTTIYGEFTGTNHVVDGMLYLAGDIEFHLRDSFRDPLSLVSATTKIREEIEKITGWSIEEMRNREDSSVYSMMTEIDAALYRLLYQHNSSSTPPNGLFKWPEYGEHIFSTHYPITDDWKATFFARIRVSKEESQYG